MIPSWPRNREQWRILINLILVAIVVMIAVCWARMGHGQTRYVVPCTSRLAKASMDSLAKFVGIREATNHNDGREVMVLLGHVNIHYPASWCAATAVARFDTARGCEPLPIARTALANGIYADATKKGKKAGEGVVKIGDCFVWQHPGTSFGHIAAGVTKVKWPFIWTIEGNTSSGTKGSQSNGGGCYRRVREIDEELGDMTPRGAIGFE